MVFIAIVKARKEIDDWNQPSKRRFGNLDPSFDTDVGGSEWYHQVAMNQ
ncbi:MAG: hypothetical protein GY903_11400 [Fuerstiella sp.]|nr:hypothetical protein [Fuerstiella sp.]MCP4855088.1 hypothetical protein [Fuerstiella sp.]